MTYRDAAFHLRDLAARQSQPLRETADELVALPVAAVMAYARLIGDPTQVRNASMLEDRLERIELALSAVATVYNGGPGGELALRRSDLAAAIDLLRRSGIAFSA